MSNYYDVEFVARNMNAWDAEDIVEKKLDELGIRHVHLYGMEGDQTFYQYLESNLSVDDLEKLLSFGENVSVSNIRLANPDYLTWKIDSNGNRKTVKELFQHAPVV